MFCICENKGADQHLCLYMYNPSTSESRNFKPLAISCGHTARFVSDLVGNPKDRLKFCPDVTHFALVLYNNELTLKTALLESSPTSIWNYIEKSQVYILVTLS